MCVVTAAAGYWCFAGEPPLLAYVPAVLALGAFVLVNIAFFLTLWDEAGKLIKDD